MIDKSYVERKQDKSCNITYAEIVDDILSLEINYSGGCAEHEFRLITNGIWIKTYPPQMELYLENKNDGDKCKEFISKKLYFKLDNLQYPGTNLILLKIQNYKNPIDYKY